MLQLTQVKVEPRFYHNPENAMPKTVKIQTAYTHCSWWYCLLGGGAMQMSNEPQNTSY